MAEKSDSKRSTRLEDLASKAGVSISTVSRALNDSPSVNRRTKQLIWKLAHELDYPFRGYMPAGPVGADATLAVVVPHPQGRDSKLSDPFFFELLSSIGEATRERGGDLIISHLAPRNYDELVYALETGRSDGVIFVGQSELHSEFNRLAEHEQRFVVWGAQLPDQQYCSIGSDNVMGGRRATRHLIQLGRRRIVYLGERNAFESHQRHRGYAEAHERANIEIDPALTVSCQFEPNSAEVVVDSLIRNGIEFDAIFAASDMIALGALQALRRHELDVPKDVSLIGYDNVPMSKYSLPPLTTISQGTEQAGRLLVAKLLDIERNIGMSERTSTELIIRRSCGG
jgi:DNA-binding LacI/PurR family transcriptional regulator